MARKTPKTPAPEPSPPVLVIAREDARRQLSERLSKGEELRDRDIRSVEQLKAAEEAYHLWDRYNVELLTRTFSNRSEAEGYSYWGIAVVGPSSFDGDLADLKKDLNTKVGRLRSLIERLDLIPEASGLESVGRAVAARVGPGTREAFIVHGHDEAARESVARFLERLGIRAVILHEQANRGQTIIEKFEAHSDVPFAVVLLTPDDVGAPKQAQSSPQPRARQNVIFELGFFIGKLGRAHVLALHSEGVELPSDFAGVVYVKMDSGGAWRLALARELKVAGLDVDLNDAI